MTEYWKNGLKKTKQREAVLFVMQNAGRPMKALEIFDEVKKNGSVMWLSTVYRILELMTNNGIINKNFISGDDIASYELCNAGHKHYAVCISCHRKFPMKVCPLNEAWETDQFHVTGHKLEMLGYCDDCYIDKVKEGSL